MDNDDETSISLHDDDIDPADRAFDQLNVTGVDRDSIAVDSSRTSTSAATSGANESQSLKQQLPAFLIPPDPLTLPRTAAARGRSPTRLRKRPTVKVVPPRMFATTNITATSTPYVPSFDSDKAATKIIKPNYLQKGKAALHPFSEQPNLSAAKI